MLRIIQRLIHSTDINAERRSQKRLELRYSEREEQLLVLDIRIAVYEFLVPVSLDIAHRIYDIAFLENIQVTRIPAIVQRLDGDGVGLGLVGGVLVILDLLCILKELGLITERLLTGLPFVLAFLERVLGIPLGLSVGHPSDALLFGLFLLLELGDGGPFRRLTLFHVFIVDSLLVVVLLLLGSVLRRLTDGIHSGVLVVRALAARNIEDVLTVIDDLLVHLMNIGIEIEDELVVLIAQDEVATKGSQNIVFDGIGDRTR